MLNKTGKDHMKQWTAPRCSGYYSYFVF